MLYRTVLDNPQFLGILHNLKPKLNLSPKEIDIASVRGNSFKTIRQWAEKRLGKEEHTRFVTRMATEVAHTHTQAESRFWYPLEHLTAIYEHILTEIGKGDERILEEVGSFIAETDLGGVLKSLVAFIPITRAISRTPFLWPRYDDSGEFNVLSIDKDAKRAALELADYEGGPLHCVIIRAWLERGCELIGGKEVGVRETRCRWKDGGTVCQWELTWK